MSVTNTNSAVSETFNVSVDETLHQNFQNLLQLASVPWEGCNLQAIYIETVYFTDNAGGCSSYRFPLKYCLRKEGVIVKSNYH